MNNYLNLAGAVGVGVAFSLYLPVLGQTGRILDSAALANVPFFFIGAVTCFVFFLLTDSPSHIAKLATVPPWMFLAGLISGLTIMSTAFIIPRIGPGPFFVLAVAGQIVAGAFMSHFGIFGAPVDPVTLKKVAGIVLVVGGAYLATLA
jgi:transporter family-2 protein